MAITAKEALKVCADCGEAKLHSEFGPEKSNKDGLYSYCYVCHRRRNAGYYKRWTPEQRAKHRARVLRTRYGMELEELIDLYQKQEGCCAICGKWGDRPAVNEKRKNSAGVLQVDHNHESGEVRGLLCGGCNIGLGKFQDDGDLLVRAASYLKGGE